MFFKYLNDYRINQHACNPSHFCDCYDEDIFVYADEKKTSIIGIKDGVQVTKIVIPENIVSVRASSFKNQTGLTSVEWNATNCVISDDYASPFPDSVTSFTIGENVEQIPSYLCEGLQNLTAVDLPISLTSIGFRAFADSGILSIDIPDSVISIGGFAFYKCLKLNSVHIPDTITLIDGNTFAYCSALQSISLPSNLVTIAAGAFMYSGLETIDIPDGVMSIRTDAFKGCALTSVSLDNALKIIGDSAFANNTDLTITTLPDGVESIGASAFEKCNLHESTFTIPGSVTFMGAKIFGQDAFYQPKEVVLSEGITEISANAFEYLDTESMILPSTLVKIGEEAFRESNIVNGLVLPDSVTELGAKAFYLSRTKTLTLSSGITDIKEQTFYETYWLPITIPATVTTIASNAFEAVTINKLAFINNSTAEGYPWGATIIENPTDE